MTTATTEKPVTNTTVLNALRDRFSRQAAALHSQPEEDQALADLAKSILAECVGRDDLFSRLYSSQPSIEEVEARAQEAIELLRILNKKVEERVGAPQTYRLLWDVLVAGWVRTYDKTQENTFARALLAMRRSKGTDQVNQLDAALREGMRETHHETSRLLRLLKVAEEEDNEIVIRRIFQTLGKMGNLPDLFFAAACLSNAGGSAPSKRIAPQILQYIKDMVAAEEAVKDLTGHGIHRPLSLLSYRVEGKSPLRGRGETYMMAEGGWEISDPRHVTIRRYMPVPENGLEETQKRVQEWLLKVAPEEIKKWRTAVYVKTGYLPGFEIKIVCILVKFKYQWAEEKDPFSLATLEHNYE